MLFFPLNFLRGGFREAKMPRGRGAVMAETDYS